MQSLKLLEFEGGALELRPSVKHRKRIMNWPTLTNRQELDAFIWLIPFLQIFILGRLEHVLKLKETYLKQEQANIKTPKLKEQVKECDLVNLKPLKEPKVLSKKLVQTQWVKKNGEWTGKQQALFDYIKQFILENAMAGANPKIQFHIAIDASKTDIERILFQLPGELPGTEVNPKHKASKKIIMFLLF